MESPEAKKIQLGVMDSGSPGQKPSVSCRASSESSSHWRTQVLPLGSSRGGQQWGVLSHLTSQPMPPEYTNPGIPQRRSSLDFPRGEDEEQGICGEQQDLKAQLGIGGATHYLFPTWATF